MEWAGRTSSPRLAERRDGKVVRLEIFAGRERALAAVALTAEDELVGESRAGRRRGVGDD